jgi:uncharacterized phage protein gp47/JayE
MAYENKTIEEVRDLILNAIKSKFNLVFRLLPKSFMKVIAAVFAGVFIICYKQIGWLFLQLFPETASWRSVNILGFRVRPLIKWGILIGVGEPKTGSQWRGKMNVGVVNAGGVLAAGIQLKSDITGKLYITESGVPLEGEAVQAPIISTENGSAGNLEAGDALIFASSLGNVGRTATVSEVTAYAEDDETETSYRARIINRFRSPPQGGALADYRIWASDVPGVLNVYPYKDTATATGVIIYVSGAPAQFPDRIPTADLLRQVGDAITYNPITGKASRKPIAAVIDPANNGTYGNIKAVSIKQYNVFITGVADVSVSDFTAAGKPAIENYFLSREPYIRGLSDDNNKTNIISRNSLSSVIDQVCRSLKAEFDVVTLKAGSTQITTDTLGFGQLCRLNELYVNGGKV